MSSSPRTPNSAPGTMEPFGTQYSAWKSWDPQSFSVFDSKQAAYYEAEIGSLLPSPGGRVLEIGFGNGSFLGYARAQNLDCFGTEANSDLRARALAVGIPAVEHLDDPLLLAQSGGFDLIVAFDVLEHIPQGELPAFLTQIKDLLSPDGHFIARFPNGDSPFGRVGQHGDVTHVTTLGHHKVQQLAGMAGLRVVCIRDPKNALFRDGFVLGLQRLLARLVKRPIEAVIRALYFSGDHICFDRSCVAVFRK